MNIKLALKRCALGLAVVLALPALFVPARAVELSELAPGSYPVGATLSCYVNAMGGVEFGQPLLEAAELNVAEDGAAALTLSLGKSSVTIYSVTCDTFVDAAPDAASEYRGVDNGTLGYYDSQGTLHTEDVSYTLSQDTALNPRDEEVAYVDSITFPITELRDEINLTMYINSNVMGVQFCNPNDAAETSTYACTLTVDWSSLTGAAATDQPSEEAAETTDADTESSVTNMDGLNLHEMDSGETVSDSGTGDTAQTTEHISADDRSPMTVIGVSAGGCLMVAGTTMVLVGWMKVRKETVRDEKP